MVLDTLTQSINGLEFEETIRTGLQTRLLSFYITLLVRIMVSHPTTKKGIWNYYKINLKYLK